SGALVDRLGGKRLLVVGLFSQVVVLGFYLAGVLTKHTGALFLAGRLLHRRDVAARGIGGHAVRGDGDAARAGAGARADARVGRAREVTSRSAFVSSGARPVRSIHRARGLAHHWMLMPSNMISVSPRKRVASTICWSLASRRSQAKLPSKSSP